jgi:uncharacterized protein YyaL (SSP411 family)
MTTKLHFSPRPNRAAEIRWRAWGPGAFGEAAAEHKPVLLAISAVWCHWCHVMDETSYSDEDVIGLINERFIPVRVDNDQRPDVNARYNMGGWPTTVVLTPEGEILRGGTYIPPEAMHPFLKQVCDLYGDADNRLEFARRIAEIRAKRAQRTVAPASGALDPNTARSIADALSEAFDDDYGGFGTEQKFPQTDVLHFLLDYWSRTRDGRAQTMVQMTLRAMASGGMYDHVEGGFFRYSTTRDFSVPHFEKMLEDLGGLLLACARASAMFGDAPLGRIAVDVKRYLDATLWSPGRHGYGGSQDADEDYYGLDEEARKGAKAPYVDTSIYTSWNAEAAHALIVAGPLLAAGGVDAGAWVARGVEILDMLWSALLADGLMARYFDGAPHIRGLLSDQVWAAWAALAAFSATGEERWLDRGRALVENAGVLYDETARAYLDRLPDAREPGRVSEAVTPMPENALMAQALLALSALTGQPSYAERARAILERFASSYATMGIFAASYASSVLDALEPALDVKIVGPADDESTRALRDRSLATAAPPLRVNLIDPADRARAQNLHVEPAAQPVAYLCRAQTCFAKATTPETLSAALR